MTVDQISVFLENKPGTLSQLTQALFDGNINMRALSLADSKDFGIVRIIADDPVKADEILKKEGLITLITPVIAVTVPDTAGSLDKILKVLADNNVNVEYSYAFLSHKEDFASLVLRVTDNDIASKVLADAGIELTGQNDL